MIDLRLGDCLEVMKTMGDKSVDWVITDPPYGIDYNPDWDKYDGSKGDFKKIIGDNVKFNPGHLLKYKNIVLFGANYFSDELPLGGWICWDKRLDEKRDNMIGSPFELAWFRSETTSKKSIMIRLLSGGVINPDSINGNNEKRLHPTQKPVSVMRKILEIFTREGDTILDPYMGSGTTGIACKNLKRNFIGIELDPTYFEIAKKRIEGTQEMMF